ncbi:MAG: rhodanese-like domain-containing protein [Magnetospiraceae bacterium]
MLKSFFLGTAMACLISASAMAADLVPTADGDTVTVDSFQAVMAENPESIYLIDVRDAGEFAQGTFKGAINIPVEQLEDKVAGLPNDKPTVFVCTTGARSGEAYDIVKMVDESRDVYFLNAEVTFKADGNHVVTPIE